MCELADGIFKKRHHLCGQFAQCHHASGALIRKQATYRGVCRMHGLDLAIIRETLHLDLTLQGGRKEMNERGASGRRVA